MQLYSSDNCTQQHYNVEILNLFNPEFQLINTELVIKNKLKELLSQFKKFKVPKILDYKKRNDRIMLHSSTKLTIGASDIDVAFKSMHQSTKTIIKSYDCNNWIVFDEIIKHSINIFFVLVYAE